MKEHNNIIYTTETHDLCKTCFKVFNYEKNDCIDFFIWERHLSCNSCKLETDRGWRIVTKKFKPIKNITINKSRHPERGHVYFVCIFINGQRFVKIGKARNINNRFKAFPVQFPVETIPIIDYFVEDVYAYEKYLHEYFSGKRVEGEWFTLSDGDLYEIKHNWHKIIALFREE